MDNVIDSSKTILWQYANANKLINLLQAKDDLANMMIGRLFTKFRKAVFDIHSKTWLTDESISEDERNFSLWVWGSLLGVNRPKVNGVLLSLNQYRRLLLAKNHLLFSNGSLADINRYCSLLFNAGKDSEYPSRRVIVTENVNGETMTIKFDFNWGLTKEDYEFVNLEGVLPHPTGVERIMSFNKIKQYFGFDGFFANQDGSIRLFSPDSRVWYLPNDTESAAAMVMMASEQDDDLIRPSKPPSMNPPLVAQDPKIFNGITFTVGGIECTYDADKDNYFYTDASGSVKWIISEDGEQLEDLYDAAEVESRHKLTLLKPNEKDVPPTYAYFSGNEQYIRAGAVYGRAEDGTMKELMWDSVNKFWYYNEGTVKTVLGQSKGNFDNSNFKE